MTQKETELLLRELDNLGIQQSLSEEQLAVMQAYIDGKDVQCRHKVWDDARWEDCTPVWSFNFYEYRVKPAPIRPYTLKEFAAYISSHLDTAYILKDASTGVRDAIVGLDLLSGGSQVVETVHSWHSLDEFASRFTWEDGTPCGMIINE